MLAVFKNGPRYWCYDYFETPVGAQREFADVKAAWWAEVKLPKNFADKGAKYYKMATVARDSHQGYKKGQRVFILDGPDGTTWIMQTYSRIIDPTLSYEDLMTLDKKIDLPEGWKFRTKELEKDLVISAINGKARVLQDNLENTYNALFEMDGQTNYTYKP